MPRTKGSWTKETRPVSQGRPKGAPNRSTAEMRAWMKSFVDRNFEVVEKILIEMSEKNPALFIATIFNMLEYVMPRYQREEEKKIDQRSVNVLNINIDSSKLTKEEIYAYFNNQKNGTHTLPTDIGRESEI